ncbi:MAG: hydroxymethylglutaryl-CoA lyase [Pseudomonadota bacterium]
MGTGIDIEISEVGPRDGLQSLKQIMPTEAKKAWIRAQFEAGTPEIEVASFVSPRLLPQMADAAEVTRYATSIAGLTVAVLVPNLRGLEGAVASGAHKVSIPFSMSETHSIKNVKKNHAQMKAEVQRCLDFLSTQPADRRPKFEVGLATAFGCTLEGAVPEAFVIRMAAELVTMGVDEVGLSDTTGYGNPAQLKRLAEGIWAACGRDKLNGVHLHNTRGQGLANALMAVELGITTIDASLGGIGGCPFAPGASGNIVTEDLVFLLESMGLNTGIDLQALFSVREQVQAALPGAELYGFTPSAGLPLTYPANAAAG